MIDGKRLGEPEAVQAWAEQRVSREFFRQVVERRDRALEGLLAKARVSSDPEVARLCAEYATLDHLVAGVLAASKRSVNE
jgi:hypothetical protein